MKPTLCCLLAIAFATVFSGCLSQSGWDVAKYCSLGTDDYNANLCQQARERMREEKASAARAEAYKEGVREAARMEITNSAWNSEIHEANWHSAREAARVADPELAGLQGGWCNRGPDAWAGFAKVINVVEEDRIELKEIHLYEMVSILYTLRSDVDGWYQLIGDHTPPYQPEGMYDRVRINESGDIEYHEFSIHTKPEGYTTRLIRCGYMRPLHGPLH